VRFLRDSRSDLAPVRMAYRGRDKRQNVGTDEGCFRGRQRLAFRCALVAHDSEVCSPCLAHPVSFVEIADWLDNLREFLPVAVNSRSDNWAIVKVLATMKRSAKYFRAG